MTTQFQDNVKKSFSAARQDSDSIKSDVSAVKSDVAAFKDNISDWMKYLDETNKALLAKIDILEKRMVELESERIARSMQREEYLKM